MKKEELIKTVQDAVEEAYKAGYVEAIAQCLASIADSLERKTKTGHWIDVDETHGKCDRCGAIFEMASPNGEANYCPNCGTRMEGKDD